MKRKGFINYLSLISILLFFLIFAVAVLALQFNVLVKPSESVLTMLDTEVKLETSPSPTTECLLLYDDDAQSILAQSMMTSVLSEMQVGFLAEPIKEFQLTQLNDLRTLILAATDIDSLGNTIIDVMNWVKTGGHLQFAYIPASSATLIGCSQWLGINHIGNAYSMVDTLHFTRPFMLGGTLSDYHITDPYESSVNVTLDSIATVYLESQDHVPLIWTTDLGQGRIVIDNLNFFDKAYRGFYSASYSLLEDVFAYPVINASTFYLDDFPSPVPEGNSFYVKRDFGLNIADFYSNIWWPDILALSDKYGIRYTGLVIEEYSDQVKGRFTTNVSHSRYQYFGNLLLNHGGEIGLHGYNHMPLVLDNFNYGGEYDSYIPWNSRADMHNAIEQLYTFCHDIFKKQNFQVYVPPSNILSSEGREMLAEDFPELKAIASVYLNGNYVYVQEFTESEDGIVETPRVISGCILDDYMRLAALSELNMHYVNTHFMHPDDVLDDDRGAELGWKEMYDRFCNYVDWLYTATPQIRNLTGSELAGAVQRYHRLGVDRIPTDTGLDLHLNGFVDEAWLFVRINRGTPVNVNGGSLENIEDNLYLLKATSPDISISLS